MSGFMNPAEFANIAKSERDFWWYRGMRTILLRMLDPYLAGRKIDRALDAGCGTGYFAHWLQTERHWPIVPMDVSWNGLSYARDMGIDRPVQADITSMPFADCAFDLVISVDVLSHLPRGEESRATRELSRVMAPGGLLFLRNPALEVLRSRHSEFILERQRFTRRRLVRLMAGAGVRALRCTYANSLLLPVAMAKFRLWEPLLRQPAASGVEPLAPWLDRLLYQPLAMEAAWIGAGRDLPAGQSLLFIGEKIG
jgi:SAM-dependent methyltransferase